MCLTNAPEDPITWTVLDILDAIRWRQREIERLEMEIAVLEESEKILKEPNHVQEKNPDHPESFAGAAPGD